jgi:predicted 2-oxoglutarate/Fe(II)-dependent dioxygenase YbiX
MNNIDKLVIKEIEDIDLINIVKSYPEYVWLEAQAAHSRYKKLKNVRNTDIRNCSSALLLKKDQKILDDMLDSIIDTYSKNNNIHFSTKSYQVVRYTEGQFFIDHTDATEEFPRKISALLYLNDDYTGGEIVFTKLGLSFKPKKNTLIIFPSSSEFSHSAEPIKSGTKYVIVGFWS